MSKGDDDSDKFLLEQLKECKNHFLSIKKDYDGENMQKQPKHRRSDKMHVDGLLNLEANIRTIDWYTKKVARKKKRRPNLKIEKPGKDHLC